MSSAAGQVDKSCPKCAAAGDVVKATTAQGDQIVVALRCPKCGHTWSTNLISRNS